MVVNNQYEPKWLEHIRKMYQTGQPPLTVGSFIRQIEHVRVSTVIKAYVAYRVARIVFF